MAAETGFLIPSLRRLRHFTSLSARNLLVAPSAADGLPHTFFTLSTGPLPRRARAPRRPPPRAASPSHPLAARPAQPLM